MYKDRTQKAHGIEINWVKGSLVQFMDLQCLHELIIFDIIQFSIFVAQNTNKICKTKTKLVWQYITHTILK